MAVTTNDRVTPKPAKPSDEAPEPVVAFEVSRTGVVSVKASDLLRTQAAKSQIKALESIERKVKAPA